MVKIFFKSLLVLFVLCLSLVVFNSLGCNYSISFTDNNAPYTGFCRLGRIVLHYTDEDQNEVRVEGINISMLSQFLVYITKMSRIEDKEHKGVASIEHKDVNSIEDIPNYNLLAYGFHRVSKGKVLIFKGKLDDRFFMADINGDISLYDSIMSHFD